MTGVDADIAALRRAMIAARDFLNRLPLNDGASKQAVDREFIGVTLIPEGLLAADHVEAELAALLARATQAEADRDEWQRVSRDGAENLHRAIRRREEQRDEALKAAALADAERIAAFAERDISDKASAEWATLLAEAQIEAARLREQRDALRADYGDALKEVDELLDLMDAGREHIEPHDPIAPFLSAGWQCPVCDRRGNLHDERCLVLEIAAVARRRKNGNRRLVVTNGRLRARAEAAEARLGEAHRECARLQQALEELAECVLHGWTSPAFTRSKLHDRAVEIAREALAGPGSEQSSLTQSGSAGLPDTPGECRECDRLRRLLVEHHAAGVMEGVLPGDVCPVCARPDTPAETAKSYNPGRPNPPGKGGTNERSGSADGSVEDADQSDGGHVREGRGSDRGGEDRAEPAAVLRGTGDDRGVGEAVGGRSSSERPPADSHRGSCRIYYGEGVCTCGADSARHNHVTREIRPKGECPACDKYWQPADSQEDKT